jgi:NADH dehydrogenase
VLTFEEILKLILAETNRCRCLMRLPFWTADVLGMLAPILPRLPGQAPMITRDQARLLRRDNVVTAGAPGLKELNVAPTALELVLPTYLDKYRRRSLI